MDGFAAYVGRALNTLLRFYLRPFDKMLRQFESLGIATPAVKVQWAESKTRDERIAKIDVARENLQDALAALGDLKAEAEHNQIALNEAIQKLDATKAGHAFETKQLEQVREIAEADIAAFRRLAGINPTRERFIGFLGGVFASLIAAALWRLGEWVIG
jgi:hypothetical protein